MSEERMSRDRDLILPPRTQAFVLDTTKGKVSVFVGPSKTSLSNTDQLVIWDVTRRKFTPQDNMSQAVMGWAEAAEGQYIILHDPAKNDSENHPKVGTSMDSIELDVGCKTIISGPCTFPLWPGQVAKTIDGHRMATNQYVVVRVTSPELAKKNWKSNKISTVLNEEETVELTMGQLIIIKGTDVSFYMPSTGLEVISDYEGEFVRDAITLEQLEYCILLNENGTKRFVHGPNVVFPEPTEQFVMQDRQVKFKALELNPQSGVYVKVTSEYEEEGKKYFVGDELFITGSQTAFYFPRNEHTIICYGNHRKSHAIAIPKGEGRYILNRETGEVSLVKGPKMFLPDPRTEVIIKRILDTETIKAMYPNNKKVIEINEQLLQESNNTLEKGLIHNSGNNLLPRSTNETYGGDAISRGTHFTSPRTITLDTKYDGAVQVNVWPGYAVMVVNKHGDRRVEIGPINILLEYDESLAILELSTGCPKTDTNLYKTCYLRIINNAISDIITLETKDFVPVKIRLSYRVDFIGENEAERIKWFNVENYVKILTEHFRSRLRNIAKQYNIQDLYNHVTDIIRNSLLGSKGEQQRKGFLFEQNNMHLRDVEILEVNILDQDVSEEFENATFNILKDSIRVSQILNQTKNKKIIEELKREQLEEENLTYQKESEIKLDSIARSKKQRDLELSNILALDGKQCEINEQKRLDIQMQANLDLKIEQDKQKAEIEAEKEKGKIFSQRIESFSPQFISALNSLGDKTFVQTLVNSIGPAALASGVTTADMLSKIFKDTPFESIMNTLANRPFSANNNQLNSEEVNYGKNKENLG